MVKIRCGKKKYWVSQFLLQKMNMETTPWRKRVLAHSKTFKLDVTDFWVAMGNTFCHLTTTAHFFYFYWVVPTQIDPNQNHWYGLYGLKVIKSE